MAASHNLVFPVEIFSQIIDRASERHPNYYGFLSEEQVATLGACGLTCRFLHHLSRPQLFRRVGLQFSNRLVDLMDLLESHPDIKKEIQEVRVFFGNSQWLNDEVYDKFTKHSEHPSKLPAVRYLSMMDGDIYTEGGRVLARPSRISRTILDFCQKIIQSYVKLPTFRSLDIEYNFRAKILPYTALHDPIPTLTELRLVDIDSSSDPELSSYVLPHLGNLQRLTIEDCSRTFMRLISKSTSITDLSLGGDFELFESLPTPTFKLSTLDLRPTDKIEENYLTSGLDFLCKTNQLGFKPIAWLRNLSITIIVVPDDLITVNRMFEDLKYLQSLSVTLSSTFTTTQDLDNGISFSDLELERHIKSSFPSLTSFSFSFPHDTTDPILPKFVDLFSSLTSAQELREVKIMISIVIPGKDGPLYDATTLPSLISIISCSMDIKRLEHLEITLEFSVPWKDSISNIPILSDEMFLREWRSCVLAMERSKNIVLHLCCYPTRTLHTERNRYFTTSQSACISFYPKQAKRPSV
ncbi:hypothetical protein CVT24_012132 [Panaeolus cyanescens]|uniref:F-box domain-containing protein n=1 Tax=Panaeolus cyanescens TaxID=181874 RepID=A0A409YYY4_9AGAR|nr:hypothetical protein CVT24_012132 [Panaeolus cyanescens]